ncbi:hypothetical protein B0J14DRAFT_516061 [Halenospora varia]|nr:hypothetical protein B0J14DRAFT_516061 [Halenospora varia]
MSQDVPSGSEPRDIPLIQLGASSEGPSTTPSPEDRQVLPNGSAPPISDEAPTNSGQPQQNGPADPINLAFVKREPAIATAYWPTEADIIGVPAIYGHPENTWTPRAKYFQDDLDVPPAISEVKRKLLELAPLTAAFSAPPQKSPTSQSGRDKPEPCWLTRGIRDHKQLQKARVLLYDHGAPEDDHTLKGLATRLLKSIKDLRAKEESRPIFFVCHSTGGIIVKMALALARRSKEFRPILGDCYGVTFFATPHRGSSYLSMPVFSDTITEIMRLSWPLPEAIASRLSLNNGLLLEIDNDFKELATDFHIWSFFETVDSDLTNPDLIESERFPFHAPITSIKSALLNLRHEVVYPLLSDHAQCASFDSDNAQTKSSYLEELARAVKKSCELSKTKHVEMSLESRVQVEVNGFYEGDLTAGDDQAPIRVWSTNRPLSDFKEYGPAQLLRDRLAEVNLPPTKHLRHQTRAPSLLPKRQTEPKDTPTFSSNPFSFLAGSSSKISQSPHSRRHRRAKSKDSSGSRARQRDPVFNNAEGLSAEAETSTRSNRSRSKSATRKPERIIVRERQSRPESDNALGITTPAGPPTISEPVPEGAISTSEFDPSQTASSLPAQPFLLSPMNLHRTPSPSRGRRRSESAVNAASLATFTKPDVSKQRLVWIHVPYNNPSWVKDIMTRISAEKGRTSYERLLNAENWQSKHVRGRHAEHHSCFVKPGCSFLRPHDPTSPSASPNRRGSPNGKPIQMCLFLPFLHFDTYKALVGRRKLIKQRVKQGRSRPVPQSVAKMDSLELKILWQFLGHDPPINSRRTLDQFGYPGLLDTRARDDDQMLYKMTKQRVPHSNHGHDTEYEKPASQKIGNENGELVDDPEGESEESESETGDDDSDDDILDGNVLMVDQVWLWVLDNETTLSFFPKRETRATDGRLFQQADLRNSIFNEVNADLTSRCENSWDLAALIALHAVTVLCERSSHPDLEIFRIFEEAISILTEKMTTSFKRFRARGFRDKAIDQDDAIRTTNIRAKHKREGAIAEKQNRENTSALLELRDIEDELKTLETLFTDQKKAIDAMIDAYKSNDLARLTTNGLPFLRQAATKLDEYKHQVAKMIDSVRSTRDDFDKLLGMVQRQAQVDEVRLARLQADLASAQSRSVMIFTVFTVIFLPLTFFTGLFGMNTREWGGGTFLTLKTIGIIAIPSSFVIITLALIVAWSTRMRHVFNIIAHSVNDLYCITKKGFTNILIKISTTPITDKEERKRSIEAKKKKKRAKREVSWLDEDFWEDHKVGREENYRLPLQNRKSVSLARRNMVMGGEMRIDDGGLGRDGGGPGGKRGGRKRGRGRG